jgi:hypothetical protein
MQQKQMHQLIQQLENYTECWKHFNHFVNLARGKKFGSEEETQFLEVKTVMVQQLELILSSIEAGTPSKEEILGLIGSAPSLRYLAEMNDSGLRNLESQWHKLYIGWHSVLGQLKVQQRVCETRSILGQFFDKKK